MSLKHGLMCGQLLGVVRIRDRQLDNITELGMCLPKGDEFKVTTWLPSYMPRPHGSTGDTPGALDNWIVVVANTQGQPRAHRRAV